MPAQVDQEFVLAKCDAFVEFQLWPLDNAVSPEKWLRNFDAADMTYAVHLLNAFMYFSDPLVDQMFATAVQKLSALIQPIETSFFRMQSAWKTFLDSCLVTYVTGENPNPTDSGYAFSRKARQVLGIAEERIVHPAEAIALLLSDGPRPLIFVDDFVGSGNQFVKTWWRRYPSQGGVSVSFAALAKVRGTSFWYCPLVSTKMGMRRIQSECPGVHISAAHLIPPEYSATSADSLIWPQDLRQQGREFIRTYSLNIGISDDATKTDYWEGFGSLGLTLAFCHSVPDATLPLFYWDQNGWEPLVRRK